MEKVRVVALGGLNESGKNCYCLEVDGDIFVIEAGLKYPSVNNPGIDFVIPNFDYLRKNASRVKAIIITHAHDGQYGALPYLLNWVNVPVYTSSTTISMIRMDFQKKFHKFGTYKFVSVVPSSTVTIAGHVFDFFQTTHSMPNSFGFALHTSCGNIIYSSDFISDYSHLGNYSFDMPRMCQIAEKEKTLLLMCESEGCMLPGTASPKHRITPFIAPLMEDMKGPLVVAIYTTNFYNIEEIIKLAVKFHKVVSFSNNTFTSFLKTFNASGDLIIPAENYIPFTEIRSIPPKDRVIIMTESGLSLFSDIKDLCYGARKNEDFYLDQTTTFVMACPSVPQTEIQHTEALDTAYGTGAKILNITRRDIASMHAQQEDIKMMITLFKPKYYFPVQGEFRQLMANAITAVDMEVGLNHRNIFVYDNGMYLDFDENGNFVAKGEKILANDVVVDGNIVGQVKDSVLEERAIMSQDGIILIGCLVSLKDRKALSAPDIQMRGFIYLKNASDIVDNINRLFNQTLSTMLTAPGQISLIDIRRKVSEKITRYLKKETDKEPLIICTIRNADEAETSQKQREARQTRSSQSSYRRPNQKFNNTVKIDSSATPTIPSLDLPSPRKPVESTSTDSDSSNQK